MKFKFYYAKHKITGEFIAFTTSTTDEGDIFTAVFLSKWESKLRKPTTRRSIQV